MWKETEYNFGNVKAGTTLEYTFEHNRAKVIRKFEASCQCVHTYPNINSVRVVWKTTSDILESYESHKFVYVHYQNGEMEILELKATLIP